MTQFEKALINLSDLIDTGNVVAIGETSSYLATIYFIPLYPNDGAYITFADGVYHSAGSCSNEEYQDHYDEVKAEGVQIWESEDNDE